MTNLTLKRSSSFGGSTIGRIFDGDLPVCYSLEDQVREIDGEAVQNWKVPHVTAIPRGRYRITLENSPRFGPDTLTVNDVPGFSGVRMHAGNSAEDTDGCILLGMAAGDYTLLGGTSRPAVQMMKELVEHCVDSGEEVWLEITDA